MSDFRALIVSEKPSITRRVCKIFIRDFGAPLLVTHTMGLGPRRFAFPRGQNFSAFPYIGDPKFKPSQSFHWANYVLDENGLTSFKDPVPEMKVMVNATDVDHRGIRGFISMVEHLFGDGASNRDEIRHYLLTSYADGDLGKTFPFQCNPHLYTPDYPYASYAEAKDYFDFNFAVNSLAIFRRLLPEAAPGSEGFVSKWMLLALYIFRDHGEMKEGEAIKAMENWKGSGKYEPFEVGTITSRCQILENLKKIEMLCEGSKYTSKFGIGHKLTLSPSGKAFLDKVHPDCKDPDLPARLHAWCEAGLGKSKPAINRYIRTFFGKTKRFQVG